MVIKNYDILEKMRIVEKYANLPNNPDILDKNYLDKLTLIQNKHKELNKIHTKLYYLAQNYIKNEYVANMSRKLLDVYKELI